MVFYLFDFDPPSFCVVGNLVVPGSPICLFVHHHKPFFHPTSYANHKPHTFPPTILSNHATPTSSSYHPLTFRVNVGSQPDSLPNPPNNAHAKHFPPSTILAHTINHDHTPQPTPISPTHSQPSPKASCPHVGVNLPFKG